MEFRSVTLRVLITRRVGRENRRFRPLPPADVVDVNGTQMSVGFSEVGCFRHLHEAFNDFLRREVLDCADSGFLRPLRLGDSRGLEAHRGRTEPLGGGRRYEGAPAGFTAGSLVSERKGDFTDA